MAIAKKAKCHDVVGRYKYRKYHQPNISQYEAAAAARHEIRKKYSPISLVILTAYFLRFAERIKLEKAVKSLHR